MNKNLLIKYIRGTCTEAESREVLDWVGRSDENSRYFSRLQNLWVMQQMPAEEATDRELSRMYDYIEKKSSGSRKNGFYISRLAAWIGAACVAVLVVWLIGISPGRDTSGISGVQDTAQSYRMFYTDPGVKGRVVLPDSSVVWLNSDSKIWYPADFGPHTRQVILSGEGYFEVTPDPGRPMIVETAKNFHIEVLGTVFNLKSYEDDETAVATLYSGNIHVIVGGRNPAESVIRTLEPSQSMTIYGDHTTQVTQIDFPEQHRGWKDGLLTFENTPISEAVKMLERWHGTRFVVEDPEILDYLITAQFQSESLVHILDLIRMTSFIDYRIEGKHVFLKKR